ncbi:C2H2 and C2HC zinc finger [Glarea lozoyensis ATCC 20868]|uniref:C2H2 and C2HC zinc finger n=1 Tax=Glarea lozoyensis (strain ATCC 20868 / MF5171) TaxID=1116229 RepID=S3CHT5_GLAL2|nr:C2H2 and C2HC zinc finger [Glarea lozoyensis ATCC 20868]EPE24819.1 C2H2 and C2HC zinc finger [Glarea lozoyensis ATCC 20868]
MYYCQQCDKEFITYNGFNMHMEHSSAHQDLDYECEFCDRDFGTEQARHQHYVAAYGHHYCGDCRRTFNSEHSLTQHMRSRTHVGTSISCPFCKGNYATASGLTIHLESGTCSSGLNRQKINTMMRQMDKNNVITKPMITMPGYENASNMVATEHAWNGDGYECYLCHREFDRLSGLNNHMRSPVHEQKIYQCPGRGCGREYKALSGLVQHVESESCGVMRFGQVQAGARNGIEPFVGRMISYR